MRKLMVLYFILVSVLTVAGCGNQCRGNPVFHTENVDVVTFFTPAAREGLIVPQEELSEIVEWLGTFTVGEKVGRNLAPECYLKLINQ